MTANDRHPAAPPAADPVSAESLRAAMARFSSGVSVVTTVDAGVKHAMTATAVCSVSLDPPLILVCVGTESRFHEAIARQDAWCLSVLDASQQSIARHFAHRGRDLLTQFSTVPHLPAPVSGAPLIAGALTWLECTTYARYDGGDHTIVVGRVISTRDHRPADESPPGAPLTYYLGTYVPDAVPLEVKRS